MKPDIRHLVWFNGIAGGCTARGDAQFAIEGYRMPIDGAWTDHQMLSNLSISPALGKEAQDLDLTGC